MLSASDTAYPLLKASPSARELDELYTPHLFEIGFAEKRTREAAPRVGLLLLLKTFQRLGYFVKLHDIPVSIIRHVAFTSGYPEVPTRLPAYDASTVRFRHMALVRDWLQVTPYNRKARSAMVEACVEASRVREDLADIINIAIEELVRQHYELPAFSALLRAAITSRSTVNRGYYERIAKSLDPIAKDRIRSLWDRQAGRRTFWDAVKNEPGQPTVKRIKRFLAHLTWLGEQTGSVSPLSGIPRVKLQRFAAEARALNAARMLELTEGKRYALAAALLFRQLAQGYDDGGDMLIRQVQKMEYRAKELLKKRQAEQMEQSAGLAGTLRDVTLAYCGEGSAEQRLKAIGSLLEPDVADLIQRCEAQVALATRNHFRLLPIFYRHPRRALLLLLESLPLTSTSQDNSLEQAIPFLLHHRNSRLEWIQVIHKTDDEHGGCETECLLDLSFVSDAWWPLVVGRKSRAPLPERVHRRFLELCVIVQVASDLKATDLCIPAGDKFRDYRQQLISWEEYEREVGAYGEQTGLATTGPLFVAQLRSDLEKTARDTDEGLPQNKHVRIENGAPILSPVRAHPEPEGFARFEELIKDRLPPVEILDALVETEHWLNWTRCFGPLSGLDAKIPHPRERYLLTVFCYGCNLGPVQTARSIRRINRFQLAFLNQRHITEASLNEAITIVINSYIQFPMQRLWGLGKSASADGTKWDLYPQNLMSEFHIRYGGYGGIGYYLVSDNYIALMSRFTSCGSWEGHYILDFLKENESEVKPDTVHADTQGQSTAIFGLAYLLGIQLLPRIRNWKDQHLFRPSAEIQYQQIDELFTAQVNWKLIEEFLPDLLRLAVSVKTGALLPSDLLRRFSSHSRKNKLYFALRELGRAVRSIFLLRYLADGELRHRIQTATTKSERFNQFVQWVSFGGESVIAENIRDEQRKFIKYNHLIANLLVYHNLTSLTRAAQKAEADGWSVPSEVLASMSPYQREHINRFGSYSLRFDRVPKPIAREFRKSPQMETSRPAVVLPKTGSDQTCQN